ncbi:MAG TPA: hypothetical protein VF521_03590 [Pyrinomonadaceae bacterium]
MAFGYGRLSERVASASREIAELKEHANDRTIHVDAARLERVESMLFQLCLKHGISPDK